MPPKIKISKDDILRTALELLRQSGLQALNARTIGSALNCSTQPIFSNFANMDELKLAVVEQADALCQAYMQQEVESGRFPAYKAHGMAYIRFAKEERELFKLLYMRDRSGEVIEAETDLNSHMETLVHQYTGLNPDQTKLFHLEMWAYVHGIAAMFATGFLDLEWELVSKMLTDAYQGLRKQYGME